MNSAWNISSFSRVADRNVEPGVDLIQGTSAAGG